jgi:formylglycine-generating enzyme required for sulfatase activity
MMTMWFQLVPEVLADTSRTKADLEALTKARVATITAAQQPLTVLADRYRAALQKQKDVAQASGDLQGVLAADAALAELNAGVEAAEPPQDVNVSRLRDIYHREHKALGLRVQPKIFEVESDHLRRLEKLMADLTKLGLIDDAKMVMEIRDKLSEELKIPKVTDLPTPTSGPYTRVLSPSGFVLIPAGSFKMGDAFGEGESAERPVHAVSVSAFFLQERETTKAEWDTVRGWALADGYTFDNPGDAKDKKYPVHTISWYDVVKWCNARSQKEGLTPAYYTNDAQTTVYKTGDVNVTNAQVNWAANGYRLPTEAEWEKAARGGLSGKRFPWGDTISQSQANYYASSSYTYDLSGAVNNYHPTYGTGSTPYTSPVGSFVANGYGLYDMAGNVFQWCWDWYGAYDTGTPTDPRGVSSGSLRVFRGGSWGVFRADFCRVASRDFRYPSDTDNSIGFRVARSSVP